MPQNWILFLQQHKKALAIVALVAIILFLWIQLEYDLKEPSSGGVTNPEQQDSGVVGQSPNKADDEVSSPSDRLVIKSAALTMRVEDVTSSSEDIQNLAVELGGFVTSSRISTYATGTSSEYLQGVVTIRVPSERFDDALTHIKSIAAKVESENITGQDVTEEYTDLQAEIRNLEAAEQQLLELFNRSGSVEEILKVQQQLTQVRGQIEIKKGRAQFLEESATYSSIAITLTEKQDEPIIGDEDWTPMDAIREAVRDLITFGQNLIDSILYLSIRYGLFVLLAYLAWRFYRQRQK
jgi:hypothetical protein